jgi:hypothetical protein
MADGSRHSIFSVAESTYGVTPADPALKTLRNMGTTLGLDKDSFISAELRADRQISDFRLGTNNNTGDINVELSYESFEDYLEAVLMSDETFAAGTADEIKAGVTRRSFTIARHFSDISDLPYHIYKGVEFNTLAISVPASGIITATLSAIAQTLSLLANTTTLGTPTYPAPSETHVMDSFSGVVKVGGVVSGIVTELSLNLDNGLAPRNVVGSRNIIRPSIGNSSVTGSVQVYFENSTLLNMFLDETETSLEFTLSDPEGNDYVFLVPRLKFSSGKVDIADMGPVMLPLSFQASRDSTEGTNISITKVDA